MTILFFSRLFYPHIGGVEKHVMEVGKRLIRKGYTVSIVTEKLNTGEKGVNNFEVNGINIYQISVGKNDWFKKFRIWTQIWKLRKLIKNADIIHCHDVFFWYLPFRLIYSRKPVYMTFHGYESYPISKKAIFIRKISEKLSRGNICIGDFIRKWYGTQPDFVSYGAVDTNSSSKATDQPGIFQNNTTVKKDSAIFIGRLNDDTGITIYNQAFQYLKKKYPDFEFLVVGEGPNKKLLNKNVKITEFQINPEKYYRHYHFAFVSGYLSILEAMAARRLVFAVYETPLKKDYLNMTPFKNLIIMGSNADTLVKKIEYYLLHPQEEAKIIENAYKWAKRQNWEKLTEVYLTLWEKGK